MGLIWATLCIAGAILLFRFSLWPDLKKEWVESREKKQAQKETGARLPRTKPGSYGPDFFESFLQALKFCSLTPSKIVIKGERLFPRKNVSGEWKWQEDDEAWGIRSKGEEMGLYFREFPHHPLSPQMVAKTVDSLQEYLQEPTNEERKKGLLSIVCGSFFEELASAIVTPAESHDELFWAELLRRRRVTTTEEGKNNADFFARFPSHPLKALPNLMKVIEDIRANGMTDKNTERLQKILKKSWRKNSYYWGGNLFFKALTGAYLVSK